MGATIITTAIRTNGTISSLDLVTQAGAACIEKSGKTSNDIDVLISIGPVNLESLRDLREKNDRNEAGSTFSQSIA